MNYKIVNLKKSEIIPDNNFFFRFKISSFNKYIPFSFVYKKENKYYLFSGFSNYYSIKDENVYPFALVNDNIINLFFFHLEKNIFEDKITLAESIKAFKLLKILLNNLENNIDKNIKNKNQNLNKILKNDINNNLKNKDYNTTQNQNEVSSENYKYLDKFYNYFRKIINFKNLQKYENLFSDNELTIFSHLDLRKKEIESYLKVKNFLDNNKLLEKYFSLVKLLNFNRNQFFNFFDKLFELLYTNSDLEKDYFYNLIQSSLNKLKKDTPISFKQKKVFEILDYNLLQPYLEKVNKINNYIKTLHLNNAKFEFTPFFEEKDFKVILSIKKPDDIENAKKDFIKLPSIIKKLWEIL